MYQIADGLARLLAPILSFSTDELWRYLPGSREDSVHLALFPKKSDLDPLRDPQLIDLWERLVKVRDRVLGEIEPLRKDKQIGSSLQARVVLSGDAADVELLKTRALDLPMLFIVSEVELQTLEPAQLQSGPADTGDSRGLQITIEKAQGIKCERCWRYVASVSPDAGICDRCQGALAA
jgi:isoleucyl-tRNA synthetase